mgnify:CR=1 FL=1
MHNDDVLSIPFPTPRIEELGHQWLLEENSQLCLFAKFLFEASKALTLDLVMLLPPEPPRP